MCLPLAASPSSASSAAGSRMLGIARHPGTSSLTAPPPPARLMCTYCMRRCRLPPTGERMQNGHSLDPLEVLFTPLNTPKLQLRRSSARRAQVGLPAPWLLTYYYLYYLYYFDELHFGAAVGENTIHGSQPCLRV